MATAVGLGVILLIVLGALLRSVLGIGVAYALTTLVSLPSLVDVLVWIAASGFVCLQAVGAGIGIFALLNAGSAARRLR